MTAEIDAIAARVKAHTDALNEALRDACNCGLFVCTDILEVAMPERGNSLKVVSIQLMHPLLTVGAQ